MEYIDLSYSEIIPAAKPTVCVDYLSHEWVEDDLMTSWRVISKSKKTLDNGVRLENACWRSWMKQKNLLETVTPESLNWLKDSDITWLYGPFYTHNRNTLPLHENFKLPTSPSGLKPVLKKVNSGDSFLNRIPLSKSAVFLRQINTFERTDCIKAEESRPKLRFNNQVEQCVAISSDEDDISEEEEGIIFDTFPTRKCLSTIQKIPPTKLKPEPIIRETQYPWTSTTNILATYDEDDPSIYEKDYWPTSDEMDQEISAQTTEMILTFDNCTTVVNNLYDIVSWLSATILSNSIF
ncbi:protein phosphatase regulator [Basidiobolus ranarum]|uniref:Protein phosphatase regulator n=1 Tax=Basidiobolus ranarum TaxID=34480 RepID=A0ABR2W1F1_9FUNG